MTEENASTTGTLELLNRLKSDMPEIWGKAQVVGRWVWLEFTMPPEEPIRRRLKGLGFHWNGRRKCWQHPCGASRPLLQGDPRSYYKVRPADQPALNEKQRQALEYKIVALRECPLPDSLVVCDTPEKAAEYWKLHVATNPYFNPECECFVVLLLNTRRRVKGHQLVSVGTLDTILVHPREVFRVAVISSASAVILMHNHPSGEATPSEADITVTRDLVRAGQLMKIEVLDHVIVGNGSRSSLRELGYLS